MRPCTFNKWVEANIRDEKDTLLKAIIMLNVVNFMQIETYKRLINKLWENCSVYAQTFVLFCSKLVLFDLNIEFE